MMNAAPVYFHISPYIYIYHGSFLLMFHEKFVHTANEFLYKHPDMIDSEFTAIYDLYCRPGMLSLDVGSHAGLHSIRMWKSKLSKCDGIVSNAGKVSAFDANKYMCEALSINAAISGYNIDVSNCHLSNKNALFASPFLLRHNSGLSSTGGYSSAFRKDKEIAEVNLIRKKRLSSILAGNKERIDLIKIDIEGSEHLLMEDIELLIVQHRPVVICEVSSCNNEYLSKYFKQKNYSLFDTALNLVDACRDNTVFLPNEMLNIN